MTAVEEQEKRGMATVLQHAWVEVAADCRFDSASLAKGSRSQTRHAGDGSGGSSQRV